MAILKGLLERWKRQRENERARHEEQAKQLEKEYVRHEEQAKHQKTPSVAESKAMDNVAESPVGDEVDGNTGDIAGDVFAQAQLVDQQLQDIMDNLSSGADGQEDTVEEECKI